MHQKKKDSFYLVTLQLVGVNCHLLGWASECGIGESVHLSWALSGFLMLPIHNLPLATPPGASPVPLGSQTSLGGEESPST